VSDRPADPPGDRPAITTESLVVPRHARVALLGDPATATEAWLILHGYGMTARGILHWFRGAARPARLLVAPEGLSRFYQERRGLRTVGASWMTRDDREHEIDDQLGYLDAVAGRWLAGRARVEVHGFSQGVSTACRWVAHTGTPVDGLVLWAGTVPPELDLTRLGASARRGPVRLVVGDQDALVRPAAVQADAQRLRDAGVPVELLRFPGGHTVDEELLATLSG
jgi:predicted esterase